jgi:hypothetical protein
MTQVDITAHEVNDGVLRLPLVLSVTPREDVAVSRVDQMADAITSTDRYPRRADTRRQLSRRRKTHRTLLNTSGVAISDPHHRRPRASPAPGPGLPINSCVTRTSRGFFEERPFYEGRSSVASYRAVLAFAL